MAHAAAMQKIAAGLAPLLLDALKDGDTVLVKGSNGAKMSLIIDTLKKRSTGSER